MKKIFFTFLFLIFNAVLFAQTIRNYNSNGLNMSCDSNISETTLYSFPTNEKATEVEQSNSERYKVSYEGNTCHVVPKYLTNDNSQDNNFSKNNNSGNYASASYNTGIGIRSGGWESGLSVKHFIKNNTAIEGILTTGWRYRGNRIIGLYEIQKPLSRVQGLYFFYGVGGHIGSYDEEYWGKSECKGGYYTINGRRYSCDQNRLVIGIDGIIGLEYLFQEIPISAGLDLKPFADIIGWGGSHFGDFAFTVRYAF